MRRTGLLLCCLLLFSCAGIRRPLEERAPLIRVGLFEDAVRCSFDNDTPFDLAILDSGRHERITRRGLWDVRFQSPDTAGSRSPGLILTAPDGETWSCRKGVRLSAEKLTIRDVPAGEGFHWARLESRTYSGVIEFIIRRNGVTAVNELRLEDYLKGVLPGEMNAAFPLEALKAQAIVARTFCLRHLGRLHREAPFDVCDDVHCQVFTGRGDSEKHARAVDETRSLCLTFRDELCETPYSAVCGGHTEAASNAWSGQGYPYLLGRLDAVVPDHLQGALDLSSEEMARRWIRSRPQVNCFVEPEQESGFADYSRKYFRWQHRFTREKLESIIRTRVEDIGSLLDIVPLRRGVSGRLIEVRLVGTRKAVTVSKELNIRRALSESALYSACFYIEREGAAGQLPRAFTIIGAGWGHGVGMCQIGAGILASRGTDAAEILSFYYPGTEIVDFYRK